MNTFNKYQFLHDLQKELFDAVATNQIESEDQVWEIIDQTIDNAVIYYADCFAIVAELNFTHWGTCGYGRIDDISHLASAALHEFVVQSIHEDSFLKAAFDVVNEME